MSERFYAYVDESGQETRGRIFIVGTVVAGTDQDVLLGQLEAIEARSRKRHLKWQRARPAYRQAYMHELLGLDRLRGCLFVSVFHHTRRYHETTAAAAARAIRLKARGPYKVTVLVDGLQRTQRRVFAQELRTARVNPYKVRGVLKEEHNAMIRLADALCGLVRDAEEGQAWAREMAGRLEQRGFLIRA
jgi:Protein of unknown function (DUF3800)